MTSTVVVQLSAATTFLVSLSHTRMEQTTISMFGFTLQIAKRGSPMGKASFHYFNVVWLSIYSWAPTRFCPLDRGSREALFKAFTLGEWPLLWDFPKLSFCYMRHKEIM